MEQTRANYITNSQAKNEREEHVATELGSIQSERVLDGGGRRSRVRPLSSWEMESIIALCDTFLPSIDVSNHAVGDDSVATFYQTSASMAGATERAFSDEIHTLVASNVDRNLLFMWKSKLGQSFSLLPEVLEGFTEEEGRDSALMV
ncbi:long-chain-alcohol oxidase [Sarracenia purpurea var. burkii]